MIVVFFNSESTYIRLIKEEMFLLCFLVTHIFLESTNVETIELSWYFPGIDLYFVHLNLSKQQI